MSVITSVRQPRISGSRAMRSTLVLSRLLSKGASLRRVETALPVTAFAMTTALVLIVGSGVRMFMTDPRAAEIDPAGTYAILSVLALMLLGIPVATLGAAAARLTSRNRNDRLATLRLLGATRTEVMTVTVIEAGATAAVGAAFGAALYVVALPLLGLLPFFGGPIGVAAIWGGWGLIVAALVSVILLATVSAVLGLRQVIVTPLGVRRRTDAPPRRMLILIVALVALVAAWAFASIFTSVASAANWGMATTIVILLVLFGGVMFLVNLVGTPLVAARGRSMARRATTPEKLIAGRELAANAKTAWRRVSSVAAIGFIAVVSGSGFALIGAADGGSVPDAQQILQADIQTGVIVTLAISFLLLACSVGVTQAASVIEDRELLIGLDRLGMSQEEMRLARRQTVLTPLRLAALGGAGMAVVLTIPIFGMAVIVAPMSIAILVAAFAIGFGVVLLSLVTARPLIRSVIKAG